MLLHMTGKSYTARVAPSHLNIFLNLASLYSRDPDRLLEANEVGGDIMNVYSDFINFQGYDKISPTLPHSRDWSLDRSHVTTYLHYVSMYVVCVAEV